MGRLYVPHLTAPSLPFDSFQSAVVPFEDWAA